MAFYVGQKVVCVDAADRGGHPFHCAGEMVGLQRGAIYTVVGITPSFNGRPPTLTVAGIDFGFFATRFRPVVEDSEAMKLFRKLVEPNAKNRPLVDA